MADNIERSLTDLRAAMQAHGCDVERYTINGRDTIVFRGIGGGNVLFMVAPDDLFDADGNYFAEDMEFTGFADNEQQVISGKFRTR